MIITRTNFRLPLGGGGSDLPAYYEQFGGHLITAAINKYMYVCINEPPIPDKIKLHYSQTESVDDVGSIKHGIIREALKLHDINRPIEITSMADFGAGTGMGSSSAFTVALLAGLRVLERKPVSLQELAEEACRVEIGLVGSPIGKQDQYASTFGGIIELDIYKKGDVLVTPLALESEVVHALEDRLLMFYTNTTRDANEILSEQSKGIKGNSMVTEAMHEIKEIGFDIKRSLMSGNINDFGHRLHRHWMVKKRISGRMSSEAIDYSYKLALQNGALGGKIMGAGGGGLLLLCVEQGRRKDVIRVLESHGMLHIDFRFEFEGIKILST